MSIVCSVADRTLGDRIPVDWLGFSDDYDRIRDRIARTVPGCHDYNHRVRQPDGFVLPHGPRDSRTFPTESGRLEITVNELEWPRVPAGRLLLQTVRSHDQFNTTIYGLDDRYRGIHRGAAWSSSTRRTWPSSASTTARWSTCTRSGPTTSTGTSHDFRVVSYPIARGCAASYFPETNPLVPLDHQADRSGTPVSKAIVVRLVPAPTSLRRRLGRRSAARTLVCARRARLVADGGGLENRYGW